MIATHRTAALAGTAGALVYAALKAAWAAGSDIGLGDPQALHDAFGGWEGLATWGTVVPAFVAIAVLWWRAAGRVHQTAARRLCWAGAAVLCIPGTVGLGEAVLGAVGVLDVPADPVIETPVYLVVYGAFLVMTISFVVLARQRTRPAS